jgi:hypothetical protein
MNDPADLLLRDYTFSIYDLKHNNGTVFDNVRPLTKIKSLELVVKGSASPKVRLSNMTIAGLEINLVPIDSSEYGRIDDYRLSDVTTSTGGYKSQYLQDQITKNYGITDLIYFTQNTLIYTNGYTKPVIGQSVYDLGGVGINIDIMKNPFAVIKGVEGNGYLLFNLFDEDGKFQQVLTIKIDKSENGQKIKWRDYITDTFTGRYILQVEKIGEIYFQEFTTLPYQTGDYSAETMLAESSVKPLTSLLLFDYTLNSGQEVKDLFSAEEVGTSLNYSIGYWNSHAWTREARDYGGVDYYSSTSATWSNGGTLYVSSTNVNSSYIGYATSFIMLAGQTSVTVTGSAGTTYQKWNDRYFRYDTVSTGTYIRLFNSSWGHIETYGGASYTFTGLTPGATYYIEIAFNKKATGMDGAATLNLYSMSISSSAYWPGAPSAPRSLTATPTSTTSINLNWLPPLYTGPAVVYYRIWSGSSYWDVGVQTTNYTITGLSPGSSYSFIVLAVNSIGASPESNIANATTPSPLPYISAQTATGRFGSVDLNFTINQNGGGTITGAQIKRYYIDPNTGIPSGTSYPILGYNQSSGWYTDTNPGQYGYPVTYQVRASNAYG